MKVPFLEALNLIVHKKRCLSLQTCIHSSTNISIFQALGSGRTYSGKHIREALVFMEFNFQQAWTDRNK